MSLDFYLVGQEQAAECVCRECGNEHTRVQTDTYFDANITHNLIPMAKEAGIYKLLWRPEESGIVRAEQLISPLRAAIELLEAEPSRFEQHNSPNGWGLYEHFLPWVKRVVAACEEYPDARPRASG